MRRVAPLSLLMCIAVLAESWSWQKATVVKIGHSVDKTEEQEYRRAPTGVGVESSGVATRTTRAWTYALKAEHRLYLGKVENKPLRGVHEGDPVRVAVNHGVLYVATPDGKKHRLELLESE
jgi:hypothetical protein